MYQNQIDNLYKNKTEQEIAQIKSNQEALQIKKNMLPSKVKYADNDDFGFGFCDDANDDAQGSNEAESPDQDAK